MSSVQDAFKHNRARQNVIVGGGLILTCITLLSSVSTFQIYKEGFTDLTWTAQVGLALFASLVIEGAFIWALYGFTRAFSSWGERIFALIMMAFLVFVMATNIVTHFMIVKRVTLSPFQDAWVSWGATVVFIAVLVMVLLITLAEPVSKLVRQELVIAGQQHQAILDSKGAAVNSQPVQDAMHYLAAQEAEEMAQRIRNGGFLLGPGTTRHPEPAASTRIQPGFTGGKPSRPSMSQEERNAIWQAYQDSK